MRRVMSERGGVGVFSALKVFPVIALQGVEWVRRVESAFSGTELCAAG